MTMTWLIIIFAIIQGITEFLPISSSAHLLTLQNFLDNEDSFQTLILLNFGSLGSLCFFSRHILVSLFKEQRKDQLRFIFQIFISCLPVILAGFFLSSFIEDIQKNFLLISWMLILGGMLMLLKPPKTQSKLRLHKLPYIKTGLIAVAQVFALIPGVSRLGITTLSGLWQGFSRELALKWSFILAIPLLFGASVRALMSDSGISFVEANFLWVTSANIVTFLIGLIAIQLAYKFILKCGLYPFGLYRIILGAIIVSFLAFNVL